MGHGLLRVTAKGVTTQERLRINRVEIKDIAIGAEGLGFNSRAGQIGQNVAKGSSPLPRFCVARALSPAARYTLRRNTTTIMKI